MGGDECQGLFVKKDSSKSEGEGLQACSESFYDKWFGGDGKTVSKVEDVHLSDQDGQD